MTQGPANLTRFTATDLPLARRSLARVIIIFNSLGLMNCHLDLIYVEDLLNSSLHVQAKLIWVLLEAKPLPSFSLLSEPRLWLGTLFAQLNHLVKWQCAEARRGVWLPPPAVGSAQWPAAHRRRRHVDGGGSQTPGHGAPLYSCCSKICTHTTLE